jgi:hypothetical protein
MSLTHCIIIDTDYSGQNSQNRKLSNDNDGIYVGPQIGMNPIPILGLPDLEIILGSPRIGMGIAFLVFFSVTQRSAFSHKKLRQSGLRFAAAATAAAATTAATAAATAGRRASSAPTASNSSSCRLLFSSRPPPSRLLVSSVVATRRRRRLDLIVASLCAVTIVVVVVVVVARHAVAIVILVVASRHRCRRRILSRRRPSRRRHRRRRPSHRRHHRLRINTGTPHFSLGIPISVWGSPNQNGDPQTEMGMRITNNPQSDSGIPEPKWGSRHPHTKTGIPEPKQGSVAHIIQNLVLYIMCVHENV